MITRSPSHRLVRSSLALIVLLGTAIFHARPAGAVPCNNPKVDKVVIDTKVLQPLPEGGLPAATVRKYDVCLTADSDPGAIWEFVPPSPSDGPQFDGSNTGLCVRITSGSKRGKYCLTVRSANDPYCSDKICVQVIWTSSGPYATIVADPICAIEGRMLTSKAELFAPCGARLPLAFRRSYSSHLDFKVRHENCFSKQKLAPMGFNWTHCYDWFIDARAKYCVNGIEKDEWRVVHVGQEELIWFYRDSPTNFVSPFYRELKLDDYGSAGYALTAPGQVVALFDDEGVLQSIACSPLGESITMTYGATTNTAKILQRATHSAGLYLDYEYAAPTNVTSGFPPRERIFTLLTNVVLRLPGGAPVASVEMQYRQAQLVSAKRKILSGIHTNLYAYDGDTHSIVSRTNAVGVGATYDYGYVFNTVGQKLSMATDMAFLASGATNGFVYTHALAFPPESNPLEYRCSLPSNAVTVVERPSVEPSTPAQVNQLAFDPLRRRVREERIGASTLSYTYDGAGWDAITALTLTEGGNVWRRDVTYDAAVRPLTVAYGYGGVGHDWKATWDSFSDNLLTLGDPDGCTNAWTYLGFDLDRVDYAGGGWVDVTSSAGFVQGYSSPFGPPVSYARNALYFVDAVTVGSRTYSYTLNELGWVERVTGPDGRFTTTLRDAVGRPTEVTDPAGRMTKLTYNELGDVASVTRCGLSVISSTYDRQLNAISIKDALGRPAEAYRLDEQYRPIAIGNIDGQTSTVSYAVGSFVDTVTRFDGSTVSMDYDLGGNPTHLTYSTGETLDYTYTPAGRLLTAANAEGTVTASYAQGLVSTVAGVGPVGPVAYGYDQGRVGTVAAAAVGSWVNQYTTWQLTGKTAPEGSYSLSYTNDLLGGITLPGGTAVRYAYDGSDRLTKIEWTTPGASNVIRRFAYSYTPADMIATVTNQNGEVTAYEYDCLDRLTNEARVVSGTTNATQWVYDAVGNRLQAAGADGTVAYTHASGNNKLLAWTGGGAMQYNMAGCVTSLTYSAGQRLGLSWNGLYQVQAIATNGVEAERYGYDALGRRVYTASAGVTNWYVYDGAQVIADVDGTGALLRRYTYAPGIDRPLSLTICGPSATNVYYYITDHLGSVHALVDQTGSVAESYEYDAWGNVLAVRDGLGQPLAESALGNRYLWQGREYSWKTGLYYFRARWYDPITGRWLSNDPIGISGGLNQYVFCANNPVNFRDPFGLCSDEDDGYWSRSLDQFIYGNLTENVTLAGTLAQIGLGLTGLDIFADARDIGADFGGDAPGWQTALDLVGVLPLVGVLKNVDEVGTLIKQARRAKIDVSNLQSVIEHSRPSREGGLAQVIKYVDPASGQTQLVVHQVTDASGKILHRDIKAVRDRSGVLHN